MWLVPAEFFFSIQAPFVFLVCNTGVRAAAAAELVRASGMVTAQSVEGGVSAWNAAVGLGEGLFATETS